MIVNFITLSFSPSIPYNRQKIVSQINGLSIGLFACPVLDYSMPRSSTSKIKVAFGPILGPAPLSP